MRTQRNVGTRMISVVVIVMVLGLWSVKCSAVTTYVGDVDGFGFGDAAGWNGADGNAANRDLLGILQSGDVLPDIEGDGYVRALAGGLGDVFDNRSPAEKLDDYAKWTDVALSNGYAAAPGSANWKADEASFTFTFTVPTVGAADYGVDHFISLVYGDYDTDPMFAVVEGSIVPLLGNSAGGVDGYIWAAYAPVSWSDMTDGRVTIDIVAPGEPYVVFDYAVLDTRPIDPIPAPGAAVLVGIGAGVVNWLRRRRVI
ncbi:MAG: hypothetical protein JW720_03465 [Sedimentisphaerales bacterium]|nr:hypothetical protein [Sedimentisphaerales bacterium]